MVFLNLTNDYSRFTNHHHTTINHPQKPNPFFPEPMAATGKSLNILQRCSVAPAAAAEHRLPLTFFDMLWLYFHPIKRLLFYQHPCSSTVFQETIIPNLKKSLSETLTHYFPVAGKFLYPLESGMAELRYAPGDSVSLTFAESTEAFDFSYLTGDQARDADDFHYLVPELPEPVIDSDSESRFEVTPLLAIQVTFFPEIGLSVGITNHHIIGDASSIVKFIKAWSSVAKIGKIGENHEHPIYDRSVIEDPTNRANLFWNQMRKFKLGASPRHFPTNRVRRTFVLQKNDIVSLKNLVLERNPNSIYLSSFTVTLAHVWSCFAKSAKDSGEEVGDNEPEYFGFAVDARSRLDPPLPAAYFGNCLAFAVAESTHGRIKAEDGFLVAAELFGDLISSKVNRKGELLREADDWLAKFGQLMGRRTYGVAGSPKFDLYDADFGWGNPSKFESVSIDEDSSISLCKSREFEGGLEIGVALSKKKADALEAVFYGELKIQNLEQRIRSD